MQQPFSEIALEFDLDIYCGDSAARFPIILNLAKLHFFKKIWRYHWTIEPLNYLLLLFEFYIFKSYKPAYSKANLGVLYYYILIYRESSGTRIQ